MKCIFIVLALSLPTLSIADVVDQRDPRYQMSIEHLARAHQALELMLEEIRKADSQYSLPGFNVVKVTGQIIPVKEFLEMILMPEEKRLEAKQLNPNSMFFKPVNLSEL